jgi:putrescine aminotransferase
LKTLAARFPQVFQPSFGGDGITGRGLLIGMHFRDPQLGYRVAAGLFRRGVLVAGTLTSAHTVRIEPPLVISYEQLDGVLDRLEEALSEVSRTL